MKLTKVPGMDSVIKAMQNVLETIENDDEYIVNKLLTMNDNIKKAIIEVQNCAEKNRVSIRQNDHSTVSNHFRDIFGFWADNPVEYYYRPDFYLDQKKMGGTFDRYNFARQIIRGLYSIEYYPRISSPTKKNLVKVPERLQYDLKEYPVIEKYANGTFKIEADQELLDFIQYVKDFYTILDRWSKREF